jgi:predicted Zn-dependent protease
VCEGKTSRSRAGAGLLRSIGLEEFVAHDAGGYQELAARLAADADRRTSLRKQIGDKLARMPLFLDTLAFSDSFGALVERAYDELFQSGREAFRSERAPLVADPVPDPASALASAGSLFSNGWLSEATDEARRILAAHPGHTGARHLFAAALLRQGRGDRALTYLLAAIKQAGNSPALWHDLAVALHLNGRIPEALQALQTCLRLDGTRADSRLMSQEWEAEVETAAKAAELVQSLESWDSRLGSLEGTTAAVGEVS